MHTRPPWSWEYHPDVKKPMALVANERDVILATGDDGRSWIEVSDEDARLISASPDLLDAATKALECLTYGDSTMWSDPESPYYFLGQAIKKATEGQP